MYFVKSFLLCLSVAQVWCATSTNTPPTQMSTTAIRTTPAPTTPSPPLDVQNVSVVGRKETAITLQWEKVSSDPTYNYTLKYRNGTVIGSITGQGAGAVHYTVSPLSPGTQYDFTLFTVSGNLMSSGYNFSEVTTPLDVQNVSVVGRNETAITLQWEKVSSDPTYNYTLKYRNGTVIGSTTGQGDGPVHYTVSPLSPGTQYDFTLFTVFEGVQSSGHNFSEVTTPLDVQNVRVVGRNETAITLQWEKVSSDPTYNYTLKYRNGTVVGSTTGQGAGAVHYTVSPLSPGTQYDFTLFTVFEGVQSSGHNFSQVTTPLDVQNVRVVGRNETAITLQWEKVSSDPTYNYTLKYRNGTVVGSTTGQGAGAVHYTVSLLSPGTQYDFTLFTVFEGVQSSGHNFFQVTRPHRVRDVEVEDRSETKFTLQWPRVSNNPSYKYRLTYSNRTHIANISETMDVQVKYTVSELSPGTKYDFMLFTVFEGVESTNQNFAAATTINCANSNWIITNTTVEAEIHGAFSTATATNGTKVVDGTVGSSKVLFTGLYPGSSYNVSLFLLLNSRNFTQCGHTLTLVPPLVTGLKCDYASGGYSLSLSWAAPQGVWTQVEIQVSDQSHNVTGTQTHTIINGLQPAHTYHLTVNSVSGNQRSGPVEKSCLTDPKGVIAGSVMAVLLLAFVAFLVVFILRRKPELLSPKLFVESKISSDNFKPIPAGKFEAHFNEMSCDQNRGFGEEYEDLSTVGTEQTRKAAEIPQNRDKNRFINVLPYDWSRVKLTTINDDYTSDYINANYMPGYGNNARQYIAAQGPLPSTVNDFWRMIWEQRVQGVVMLTNCIESGKVKCEQYWPLDYSPCTYGDVSVRISSEQKESNWTLREFEVTNRAVSEVRLVKHFHFTAWPDHGVPDGTSALIQFRGLVRNHIESCGSVGPTVVHCSAGVGRTGTLIALDVTLQQLEKERVVGLAAFVHKMRLNRPLMVQTECQYVFLHQCIMDSLKPKQKIPEQPLYENVDMMYVNAVALKEFQAENGQT
ncbi:receptor-type tyrosine-protein phosphatase H-like [Megalops cyprinoides]|uniref:receptor-type tyrosine-protein phosphatase H-like n=1 Tax=Megalops cyprinoides TaxID=118141 RepID=UPI001864F47B|nr:receptor-type tyrosine-protein phosphatase H-like [Megalops cyprinoides]